MLNILKFLIGMFINVYIFHSKRAITISLFNIYMDKLSMTLNNTAIGGQIGGQLLNFF